VTVTTGQGFRRIAGVVALGALVAFGAPAASGAADAPPLVISHRGASAAAPEHTFAAYDRAVEAHTDVLECDLQMTADGVLVCMHDTTVDRTTGGTATGRVDSFTLAQLQAMDFGSWFGPEFAGAHVVPFEEQLRCYATADPGLQFEAETKAPSEYGGRMEPALVALLRRLDLVPKGDADLATAPVIIQSFELTSLTSVKKLAPSLPTVWLYVTPPAELAGGAIPEPVDALAPIAAYVQANPGVVAQAHAAGREVQTWTAEDPAVMDQLLDAGVDGIFTNETAILRAHVDARTNHPKRASLNLKPGCPGVAGTVTAATTNASTTTTTKQPKRTEASSPATSSDDTSSPLIAVAAVIVIIGGLGGTAIWLKNRRRPSSS
jgi:glycerophosphoryl diester phosphodiesterase